MSKNITETKPERQAVKKRLSELRDDVIIEIQGGVPFGLLAGDGGATKAGERKGQATRMGAVITATFDPGSVVIVLKLVTNEVGD